jgi:putative glycosyltransferase
MKISVVAPLYKSARYVDELYDRCKRAIEKAGAGEHEFVFVNDASPHDDLAVAKRLTLTDPNVIVIDLARNFGQHKAIITGLGFATGDLVFVMDSDLEEEPEWITLFHETMVRSGADVVYGVQDAKKRGLAYRAGRRTFWTLLNSISDFDFPEDIVNARLMTRRYLDQVLLFNEREMFLAGVLHVVGFNQVPVKVRKLDSSPTSYNMMGLARIFLSGVTSFSTKPLVAIAVAGIVLSLLALSFTAWIVFRKLFWDVNVEGWASVMAATLLIGGITLFFNGVMAIYIATIFVEVKQRPRTVIREIYRQHNTKLAGEFTPPPRLNAGDSR